MLVAEDSEAEVIGIWDIYPVIKVQESSRVLRLSRIRGVQQVTLCNGVIRKSCKDVFVELFYIH